MIRTFIGKNSFELKAALDVLVADTKKVSGDLGIERIDASEVDVDTILQSVQALPFLVDKKLIIITAIQSNGALLERIDELVDRTADGVDVVIVEPSLDKRKGAYKLLQKHTTLTEFKEHHERDLQMWVQKYVAEQGGKIADRDASYLIERVGAQQQLLAREVEKLIVYSEIVTKESIDLLTDQSVRSTIFSLLDAAFSGDRKKAVELYREQRSARLDPHYIVTMLAWQLQNIALAVFAEPKSDKTLIASGMAPYSAQKSLALARIIDKPTIRRLVTELSELDASIKQDTDADAAIELYLMNIQS